jgi:hypothetical protein
MFTLKMETKHLEVGDLFHQCRQWMFSMWEFQAGQGPPKASEQQTRDESLSLLPSEPRRVKAPQSLDIPRQ